MRPWTRAWAVFVALLVSLAAANRAAAAQSISITSGSYTSLDGRFTVKLEAAGTEIRSTEPGGYVSSYAATGALNEFVYVSTIPSTKGQRYAFRLTSDTSFLAYNPDDHERPPTAFKLSEPRNIVSSPSPSTATESVDEESPILPSTGFLPLNGRLTPDGDGLFVAFHSFHGKRGQMVEYVVATGGDSANISVTLVDVTTEAVLREDFTITGRPYLQRAVLPRDGEYAVMLTADKDVSYAGNITEVVGRGSDGTAAPRINLH